MSERTFTITVDAVEYVTRTYEVRAKSFEDARNKYERGYADLYDSDTYDSEDQEINEITCDDCCCDSDACECAKAEVDEVFFADLGL